jgi:hypothetical protein
MSRLTPPLPIIEASLFDPSPALMQRYLDGDPTLSSEQRQTLADDDGVRIYRRALEQTAEDLNPAEETPAEITAEITPIPLPPRLAEMVRQRVAARDLHLPTDPRPGLMARIDQALGPDGPLDWDLSRPFVALLSEPTEQPDIWYGWLMASETDYAGHWDLLLQAGDQPYDPSAAMVQTWNPIHLYVPAIRAAVGQLSPQRLAAVRALAAELGGPAPDPALAAPGTLVQRTTSTGALILTGSPLGDDTDPRWRYQELYFAAAGLVRAMAREAIKQRAGAQARSWWETVLTRLKTAAQVAGIPVTPVTVAALSDPMMRTDGRDDAATISEQTQRIGDLVELRLLPSTDGEAVQLHIQLAQAAPLTVGIARADQVRQHALLTTEQPEADLFVGADQDLRFFIRDAQDHTLFAMELHHDDAPD